MTLNIELIQLAANILVIPLCSAIYALHGRLSRIEGHLIALETIMKVEKK